MFRARGLALGVAFATTASLGLVATTTGADAAPASSAAAAAPARSATGTVTGSYVNPNTQQRQSFTGTVSNLTTSVVDGVLTLTGTITGPGLTPGSQTFTAPITAAQAAGSCTILDLTLGPLHLNLLGLVVDLNQVHLVITAQQGPGNLLGNLLCAVANLLNGTGGGGLTGLSNLLNQLLGSLGL